MTTNPIKPNQNSDLPIINISSSVSSKPPVQKTPSPTLKNLKIEDLERKVQELEEINTNLKRKFDSNYSETLPVNIKDAFNELQNELRKQFKMNCIMYKTQRLIEENTERQEEMVAYFHKLQAKSSRKKVKNYTTLPSINNLKSQKQDKSLGLISNLESLEAELKCLKEDISSKEKQLKLLDTFLKQYENEIKSLNILKEDKDFHIRNVISPNAAFLKQTGGIEKISSDKEFKRTRPRFHSDKRIRCPEFQENILRFSGKLEKINQLAPISRYEKGTVGPSKIFANINLKPGDFEQTHNFTRESVRNLQGLGNK
ncbi:hypothetical protein SteCoe_24180 [Stentor coeruleus]|uniref:Uncharacterized protein n=1 Tax=Stentor coeruleus TaxID=5963 RepID=A0A1R2BI70_9CILI|nr:hypothetical protein SteCoe_24180 [Stentor coeruleus]